MSEQQEEDKKNYQTKERQAALRKNKEMKLADMKVSNDFMYTVSTVRGKILEGENFGESLLMKQMARKILANQLAGLQLFHCIYNYWRGKIWRFVHHSPNSPKFSPSKFFPRTVSS